MTPQALTDPCIYKLQDGETTTKMIKLSTLFGSLIEGISEAASDNTKIEVSVKTTEISEYLRFGLSVFFKI